jgi:hypothetical protein
VTPGGVEVGMARATKDPCTPQELYHRIEICTRIIIESNNRLVAMRSRPINIFMTPTDVPEWQMIERKKRKAKP